MRVYREPDLWSLVSSRVSPLASRSDRVGHAGTFAAFGNTRASLRRGILGCEAVGDRAATPAHYADALGNGHTVTPCIFEVFGGFDSATVELLNRWAAKARGKTPPEVEPPWCARNFVPYWSQVLSKTVQRGAAEEILYRVREVGEARAAAHGGSA